MDAHRNFAYSTVATAPSPATSGTTLTLATGGGALTPATPFNATVWPASAQPSASNAEIVRVTNVTSDVCTIQRTTNTETNNTIARAIVVGDQFSATVTNKTLTDIETGTVQLAPATSATNTVVPTATNAVNLVLQAIAAQSADLQRWQNSTPTTLLAVGATGYIEALEQTNPATPGANRGRIYARQSAGGKTQIVAKFSSGNTVVIAEDF